MMDNIQSMDLLTNAVDLLLKDVEVTSAWLDGS